MDLINDDVSAVGEGFSSLEHAEDDSLQIVRQHESRGSTQ